MSCTDTNYAIVEEYSGTIPEQDEWFGSPEEAMEYVADNDEDFNNPVIYEITARIIRRGVKKIDWERV